MAFKLDLKLSAESKARIADESAFAQRCFEASDIELGREILKLAVFIRTTYPEQFARSGPGDGYGGTLVWEVIPEIARRLGVQDFERGRRPYELSDDSDPDLRALTGHAIFGSSRTIETGGKRTDPREWSLIQREPCNGNAVEIALSRVAPPTDDPYDVLARRIAEISVTRGLERRLAWAPSMQDYGHDRDEAPAPAPGP